MPDYAGFYGTTSVGEIQKYLSQNVVEIVFVRRRVPKDPTVTSKTRRIICTTCQTLLRSPFGMKTLRYKLPYYEPPYNAASKVLVTVWDILIQDWRNIDIKSCVLIKKKNINSLPIKVTDQKGIEEFAKFYNSKITRINPRRFMAT